MQEVIRTVSSGLNMIVFTVLLALLSTALIIYGAAVGSAFLIVSGIIGSIAWVFIANGFFTVQPNEAAALILFGEYKGTIKTAGWHWANPFLVKKKISLRARNLNGDKLKVNDEIGNPIEIAAVVVWRVQDTFEALFEVEDYSEYVETQSESALRHLAGLYPYDIGDDDIDKVSLRGGTNEVSEALKRELQERLDKAGVVVEEARLSHLAYAPEIAAAMLQRQQASAIIAARQKIVDGAVSMVQMAINKLNDNDIVQLDEERKAAMVSNLLVVLCGERSVQPVVNAGTLYT